jgi:hypothetical protein
MFEKFKTILIRWITYTTTCSIFRGKLGLFALPVYLRFDVSVEDLTAMYMLQGDAISARTNPGSIKTRVKQRACSYSCPPSMTKISL